MAVTVRSRREKIETITGNSDLSVTPGEPAGAASGDVFLGFALADIDSTTVITRPTGWTNLYNGIQGGVRWDVSYIVRGGSAPNLVWTISGATKYREVYVVACQTSGGTITLDSQSTSGGTGNSLSHLPDPGATAPVASTSLALAGGWNFAANSTWTMPAGYTVQTANATASDGILASKVLSSNASENPAAFGQSPVGFTGDWWDGFAVTFTDAGATASPFAPVDTSLPRNAAQSIVLRTFTDASRTRLIGKDTFFGAAGMGPDYDYPLPKAPQYAIGLRTFVDPTKLLLLGKDKFFGAPGQGPAYDWPLVRGYQYPNDLRTFINPLELPLLGQDKFFGAAGQPPQVNWYLPQRPPTRLDLLTWTDSLLTTTLAVVSTQNPFTMLDWPLPRARVAPVDNLGWLQALLDSTLATPFRLLDWSTPARAPYPIDLRTFLQSMPAELRGQDTLFGVAGQPLTPGSFPFPVGAAYPLSLRTFTKTRQLTATVPGATAAKVILVDGRLAYHVADIIYEFL